MELISLILTIFIAVLISGAILRVLPIPFPLPLIQIMLGMFISGVFNEGITLNPDIFFFLFLPPLLFMDGWRIPKDNLRRDRLGIFHLAFGLVMITVVGLGYLINWMIPAMPLPVAFALAAIVSPTDAVAVSGITRKLPVPKRIMSLLEGEALFNDASGLVAFRLAVAATATGTFVLSSATLSFLWVAIVGLLAGVVVARVLIFLRNQFIRRYGEEAGSEILFSLLMPFCAYMLAEHLEASGILAAVAAGITLAHSDLSGLEGAMTRVRRYVVWDMLQFTLNGTMFVLLGEQLPGIFRGAMDVVRETGHQNPSWMLVYALVICIVLSLFRFVWVAMILWVLNKLPKRYRPQNLPEQLSSRVLWLISFGGVRGAVTLAGVMSLPLMLSPGVPFPARDLAIFLAASVIIVSLITASIALPYFLRNQAKANYTEREEQRLLAWHSAHDEANRTLASLVEKEKELHQEFFAQYGEDTLQRVLDNLHGALGNPDNADTQSVTRQQYEMEIRLTKAALHAARSTIFKLARQQKISDELAREMAHRLDMNEMRLG
ncbi:Na+/H+ antiporter [Paenalcaligenes suwonensis]|uniref:Na+/H+ antiporter n=1 Tax=Paenalcaligenes suwonensis TaxID=1202713 RepID=UPI00140CEC5C|nr:Na+/H+ antiporter [Paenalcaligenes suwonensis]NHC60723.1 Na+/H+ antiporter [Paenalcaligenes suwonensis]